MTEEQTNKSAKEDKRKQTSTKNAAKARQAKLDKLKKQKDDERNISLRIRQMILVTPTMK